MDIHLCTGKSLEEKNWMQNIAVAVGAQEMFVEGMNGSAWHKGKSGNGIWSGESSARTDSVLLPK